MQMDDAPGKFLVEPPVLFGDVLLANADHHASTNPGLATYTRGQLYWSVKATMTAGITRYGVLTMDGKTYQVVQTSAEDLRVFAFPADVAVRFEDAINMQWCIMEPSDSAKRCEWCCVLQPDALPEHGAWCATQSARGLVAMRLLTGHADDEHRRAGFFIMRAGTADELKAWVAALIEQRKEFPANVHAYLPERYAELDLGAVDWSAVLAHLKADAEVDEAWENLKSPPPKDGPVSKQRAAKAFKAYLAGGAWGENRRHFEENAEWSTVKQAHPAQFKQGGLFAAGEALSDDPATAYKQLNWLQEHGHLESDHHFRLLLAVHLHLKGPVDQATAATAWAAYLDDVWKDEKRDLAEQVRWDLEEKQPDVFEQLFDCEEDLSWEYKVAFKRATWLKEHGYFNEHPAFNLLLVATYFGLA